MISGYAYTVNTLGQRTALAASGSAFSATPLSIGWGYNARGEVTSANHNDSAQSRFYAFDPIGNRTKSRTGTSTDSGGVLTSYTSNALNQYTAINAAAPSYDVDGNQLSGILPANPSVSSGYEWDGENRLLEAKAGGTTVGQYRYDPFGRRIYKSGSGGATWFVYEGWNMIAEYQSGSLQKAHLWGSDLSGSMQGAGGVGGLLSTCIGGSSNYPTYDGNGNVSEYLSSAGTIAAHFEYDHFGQTLVDTDSSNLFEIRYSTKKRDFQSGLYYYGYRYYNYYAGRWSSRDPIEERGGINLYGFVGNDGVNKVDYLGMLTLSQCLKSCDAGPGGMENFCRQIRDKRVRAACWCISAASNIACRGWCYWNY